MHPLGNPHIHTDPRNIALVAKALAQRLAEVDPGQASLYQSRYHSFDARWQQAATKW